MGVRRMTLECLLAADDRMEQVFVYLGGYSQELRSGNPVAEFLPFLGMLWNSIPLSPLLLGHLMTMMIIFFCALFPLLHFLIIFSSLSNVLYG